MSDLWPWLVVFGLGAYHGLNPSMGWLFAVALGLQEKSRRAVLAAIPPIALGHALSTGMVVLVLWLVQASLPIEVLRYGAAVVLLGFGLYRLVRASHPKWVGMRVGFRDLTLWSFIMTSAHGAGLMLVPVLLGGLKAAEHTAHAEHLPNSTLATPWEWLAALGVHSVGQFVVAVLIALLVYEKLGVAILRQAWFNLDLLWTLALIFSGVLLFFI